MVSKGAHSSHAEFLDPNDALRLHGKWWNARLLMNLVVIGFALGLFGYDNSFASPLVSLPLFVQKYQGPGFDGSLVFTARNLDLIITVPLVGAAAGACLAIAAQKYLGRKWSFLLAYSTLCIPGSCLQLFSPNLGALVLGRFWNYLGISILTNTGPIYLSELVPAHFRARAVGFAVTGSAAVSVIATAVVWASEKYSDTRQYLVPLGVQALWPVLLLALSFLLSESPTWLLSRGRDEEAKRILTSLRGGNVEFAEAELALTAASLRSSNELSSDRKWWDILKPENLERTLASAALMCLSQVGGQALVTTYSTVILVQSGVGDAFKVTILIYLLQFAGTVVGPLLLDRFGRRTVVLPGYAVLFIIDLAAGIIACTGLTTQPRRLGLASLCMIFAFVNSVSFQSIAFLLPTEIPTSCLREPTMGWALFWSYSTAIMTTFAIPQLSSADAGGLGAKTFLVFAGCMAVTVVWTYFYLPETANRTLVEIDEMYEKRIPKRRWASYKASRIAPDPERKTTSGN